MVHSKYTRLDISKFEAASRYRFMMGTVIPPPGALVTSLSRDGVLNAAPFSEVVIISVTPPPPGFVAYEGDYGLKDTVRNILESDDYVINTVAEPIEEQVQVCAGNFRPPVGEADEAGFHTLPSTFVRSGRIAESPVHSECYPHKTVEFGNRASGMHVVAGEVVAMHRANGVVSGHRVSHQAINAPGRIAGCDYRRTGARFDV